MRVRVDEERRETREEDGVEEVLSVEVAEAAVPHLLLPIALISSSLQSNYSHSTCRKWIPDILCC